MVDIIEDESLIMLFIYSLIIFYINFFGKYEGNKVIK